MLLSEKNRVIVSLFYIVFLMCSCSLSPLDQSLKMAGKNRGELQKVLDHYGEYPEDSLKFKAACFLIKHIPYYYSYAPNEIVDSLKQIKVKNGDGWLPKEVIKQWKWFHYENLPKINDIDVITADLLIENIDYAFEVWNKRSWSKYYTFEDFCEYILPYRVGNEKLEKWRKIYHDRYGPVLDSLYQGTDVVEAAGRMAAYLQSEKFYSRIDFSLPHLGALFLLENRVGYCRDGCDITSYVMRSLGIPVAMDMYYTSPSYNSRHFWSAVIDTTGMSVPFNYYENLPERGMNSDRKRGKVYRTFFGAQKKDMGVMDDLDVPDLFRNVFLRDVTDEYYPDSGFEVAIEGDSENKYAYLSIYDYDKYTPIDIAVVNGNTARFKNVEKELIYHPVFCRGGKALPAGYPFILKEGAVPFYFIPNMQKLHTAKLIRKYPICNTRRFLNRAVGIKFVGSRTFDFKNPELLYELVDTPTVNYNKVYFSKPHLCRYICATQEKERLEIAELELYNKDKKLEFQKWGVKKNDMDRSSNGKLICDSDWVTYIEILNEPYFIDLGQVECLTEMVYIPRNDDNFIHLGDTYELFYQNGVKGWISLGKQVADTTFLLYENIPEKALLWLHNLNRGKEERPFFMDGDKQIFL